MLKSIVLAYSITCVLPMEVNLTVISWTYNFLTERLHQVRVCEVLSNVLVSKTGAPQGCELFVPRPLYYLIGRLSGK